MREMRVNWNAARKVVRLHLLKNLLIASFAAFVGGISPSVAQTESARLLGSFLTGRFAQLEYDFEVAARNYSQVLENSPDNLFVIEKFVRVLVNNGDKANAFRYAEELRESGVSTPVGELVGFVQLFELQQHQTIVDRLDESMREGDFIDGIMKAWAYFGLGDVTRAIKLFEDLASSEGHGNYVQLNQALAFASVGDFGSAELALQKSGNALTQMLLDGEYFYANLVAQINDADSVASILENLNAEADARISVLRDKVAAGQEVDFEYEVTSKLGVSALFSALGHLYSNQDPYSSLIFFRLAQFLQPDAEKLKIWNGQALQNIGNLDLAEKTYRSIPEDSFLYSEALAARSELLHETGKTDESFSILAEYVEKNRDSLEAHLAFGDALRRAEEFERAAAAYSDAISLISEPEVNHWPLYFYRGITYERSGDWENGEKDLRLSLALSPNQSLVLNYLGYSMVEMGGDLEEAKELIQKAVEINPDSGYILDSLGWLLYQMEQFDEAVVPMERAASILPSDPIVNDHLGDVYWKVGRFREAEFQWKRALSFDPEPDEAKRINLKLMHGLNYALENE